MLEQYLFDKVQAYQSNAPYSFLYGFLHGISFGFLHGLDGCALVSFLLRMPHSLKRTSLDIDIMIRSATPTDFDFFYRLYMHPDINPYLLYEPMNKDDFQPIYAQLLNDGVLYVFQHEEKDAGMFKLIPLQHRTSHIAYLGGLALAPEFAGQGLALEMFDAIFHLAKSKHIKRLELSVATHNQRAIKLYEKVGFQTEGILRNYTYLKNENRFIDEQLMSCLF